MGLARLFRSFFKKGHPSRRRISKSAQYQQSELLESRIVLASNMNLSGGILSLGGGASLTDNNYTVDFDGANYIFTDTADTINAVGALTGLDQDMDPNSVTLLAATLDGLGFNKVLINGGNGDDDITILNFRDGNEGLDIRDTVGQGNDELFINGNIGTAGVNNTIDLRAETINLGANLTTLNSSISVLGTTNLTGNSIVTAGGSNLVRFSSTIDGANDLTINSDGVQLEDTIGGVTPVGSLSVTSDTTTISSSITSDGSVALAATAQLNLTDNITSNNGDVTLGSIGGSVAVNNNATFAVTSGGTGANGIVVNGNMAPGGVSTPALELIGGDGAVIAFDDIAGFTSFVATGNAGMNFAGGLVNGSVELNSTGPITLAGARATNGALDVNGSASFANAMGSATVSATTSISFSGIVDGAGNSLLIRDASTVEFLGNVSNVNLFDAVRGGASLFTDVSVLDIDANSINIVADTSTIHLGGDLTSAGGITLSGAVVLDGLDTTIELTGGGVLGDSISISGNVNSLAAGSHSLSVLGGGAEVVMAGGGMIGNTTPLDSVLFSGSGVNLNEITVINDVTFQGGVLRLNGAVSGTGDATFEPQVNNGRLDFFNRSNISTSAGADMIVDLTDLAQLTPGFANITMGGTTTGTLNIFGNDIGNPAQPGANLVLNNVVEFIGDTVFLDESVDAGANDFILRANTLDLGFFGVSRGTGATRIFKRDAGGTLTINGDLGGKNYTPNDLFVEAAGSDVVFNGDVGANLNSFNLTADFVDFGAPTALFVQGAINLNVNSLDLAGGIRSNTSSITVNGDVNLLSNVTLLVASGQDISFNGTITANGSNIIARGSGGAINEVTFTSITGAGSVRVDQSGASTANTVNLGDVSGGTVLVIGNTINTNGTVESTATNLTLQGNVNLLGNSVFRSSGLANHVVRIVGTLDGAFDLAIDAGIGRVTFNDTVGGVTPLNSLDIVTGGPNFIVQSFTVADTFSWVSLGGTNNIIIQLAGNIVTAGTSITLESDALQIRGGLGELVAPTVNLTPAP